MSRCIDSILLPVRLKTCYDLFKVICDNRTILLLLFSWCYVWLCDPMDCSMPRLSDPHDLLKFDQVHVNYWWCHPAISSFDCPLLLPIIFPSIRDFSNESSIHIRWPKYWILSFSISPSNEYSGLISLKIDWFDLLAIQGTFRSLQHHSCCCC